MNLLEGWEQYQEYIETVSHITVRTSDVGWFECPCEIYPRTLYQRIPENELPKSGQKALDEYKAFIKNRKDLTDRMTAILKSCNTTKQLLELVPELEKFVPDESAGRNALVAAEEISKVRKLIGSK